MAAVSDRRAELDLQISLLAKHQISRVITLVTQIAGRMGIEAAQDPELAELARDTAPETVMRRIEETEEQSASYFNCSVRHCAGALSGRQRTKLVPCRKRPPDT